MRRNFSFYLIMLVAFGSGILAVLKYGQRLQPAGMLSGSQGPETSWLSAMTRAFQDNLSHPLGVLLLQVIVIVLLARFMGVIFRRIGQPAVVGEMVSGILLGPSFFGLLLPRLHALIFPPGSLGGLMLLSQVGVILFMFVVGMEIDLPDLRKKSQAAVIVSHASIAVPFFLGVMFSLFIYRAVAPAQISFVAFALFMGVAMSITAFPVLARIIEERGLSVTPFGAIAMACAAVDDLTAWCLLAIVVAVVKATGLATAAVTVLLALLFIAVMLWIIRPRAEGILRREEKKDAHSRGFIAGVLIFVFSCALFTEIIGIHAIFGAFLAGATLPVQSRVRKVLRERLETVSGTFLLPLFFAYAGLRTQLGLLDGWHDWLICGGLIAIATVGKLGGSMLAARWTGMAWRSAFSVGILMNVRGLVELIVLNIGYDFGILSPRIFTMMVVMALVTTFMAGPVLSLLGFGVRAPAPTGKANASVAEP